MAIRFPAAFWKWETPKKASRKMERSTEHFRTCWAVSPITCRIWSIWNISVRPTPRRWMVEPSRSTIIRSSWASATMVASWISFDRPVPQGAGFLLDGEKQNLNRRGHGGGGEFTKYEILTAVYKNRTRQGRETFPHWLAVY